MPKIVQPSESAIVLTVPQFLNLYGIGRDLFYAEVARGSLRVAKVGSRTLISKDEAARWWDACQQAA